MLIAYQSWSHWLQIYVVEYRCDRTNLTRKRNSFAEQAVAQMAHFTAANYSPITCGRPFFEKTKNCHKTKNLFRKRGLTSTAGTPNPK